MKAEIVAVGTELLMGETADTNSGWLAERLPGLGLELQRVTVVGDEMDQMVETLATAWRRSDFVITIGGLGPTQDDITRDAIAQVLGEPLTTDPALIEWLKEGFRRRGVELSDANRRQAGIIPSATAVLNSMGTAPGWWVEKEGTVLVSMPGPPRELMEMWGTQVVPRLRAMVKANIIRTRTLKTTGLSEADVDERVRHLYGKENPYLGCYAKPDGIHLRLIAKATDEEAALALLQPMEEEIRAVMAPYLWGVDEETPEERVGALLQKRGYTLAVLESCTGGLLAGAITNVPGSSSYFLGGAVTYANQAKVHAGVDPAIIERYGAVSEECAVAMAEAARSTYGADCGLGVTGVAGPTELEGVAVGTVMLGIAHPGGARAANHRFPPRRPLVRSRAVTVALLELCQALQVADGQQG